MEKYEAIDSSGGWIKIHRKIEQWEWFGEPNTLVVWLHLLIRAAHKDIKVKGRTISRGSLLTTIAELAERTGLTIKQTRTALANLQNGKQIGKQTTNRFTIITICNYDYYQTAETDTRQTNGKQNGKQTANSTLYIKQEIKNMGGNAHTCAREGQDLIDRAEKFMSEFFAESNSYSQDCTARNVGVKESWPYEKLRTLFRDASDELIAEKHLPTNYGDWLRMCRNIARTKFQIQQNQSTNESQSPRKDKFERRRGVEPKLSQDPKDWSM